MFGGAQGIAEETAAARWWMDGHRAVVHRFRFQSLHVDPALNGRVGGMQYVKAGVDGVAIVKKGFHSPTDGAFGFKQRDLMPSRLAAERHRQTCHTSTDDSNLHSLTHVLLTFHRRDEGPVR